MKEHIVAATIAILVVAGVMGIGYGMAALFDRTSPKPVKVHMEFDRCIIAGQDTGPCSFESDLR